eukprot:COSAG02_NODE_57276_length_281_cov_0.818681_1_plen_25_part_01
MENRLDRGYGGFSGNREFKGGISAN